MSQSSSVFSFLHPFSLTKVHWRNELVMHLLFGVPIILLAAAFWDLGLTGMFKCFAMYMFLWFVFYIPLYYILPLFLLRKHRHQIDSLQRSEPLNKDEVTDLVSTCVYYSHVAFRVIWLMIIPGYLLGAALIYLGYIPEIAIEHRIPISIFNGVLGVALGLAEALFNYVVLSQHMRLIVSEILVLYPDVVLEELPIKKISLGTKLLFFIGGLVFVVETILINFFISTLAILAPSLLLAALIYSASVIVVSFVFLLILVPKFSSNIAFPLEQIVSWSRNVMDGKTEQRLLLTTNDELGDVVRYETQMMLQLNKNRRQVEKDAKVISHERNTLSAVLTGVSDGVVSMDRSFRILFMNESAKKILSLHTDSLEGVFIDDVMFLEDSKHNTVAASYYLDKLSRNFFTSEECFPDIRYVLRDRNGGAKMVSVSVQMVTSSSSSLFILTLHDLTEFLKLEDMKLDFVSMAAHELRTPLTAVKGYLSMAIDETKTVLNDEQKEYMQRSLDAASSLNSLIEDVINVSKIEKGEYNLQKSPGDIVAVITSVIEALQTHAASKQISLGFDHRNTPQLLCEFDTGKIYIVISALVTNAINYTPEGGTVQVALTMGNSEILVSVADNGIGIPKEAQGYLFTKFYRVKRSLEQGAYGTGLGLYMARQIVEMHGGQILVESEEGKGSTFSFSLPMS